MLLLFASEELAPTVDLPHLYVADPERGINVPVGGQESSDGDFLQSTSLCWVPLDLSTILLDSGPATSEYFSSSRTLQLIVSAGFSVSGASAVIRLVYTDNRGTSVYSDQVTLTALSYQENGKYVSALATLSSYGADRVQVIVESVSSGVVDILMAGI